LLVQNNTEENIEEDDSFGLFEPELPVNTAIKDDNTQPSVKPVKQTVKKTIPKRAPAAIPESSSIRVETGKIDSLVNLIGELVTTQSTLAMIGSEVNGELEVKLHTALAELQRNTREIQESVMSMRMLPMSVTFNRFPRVVRDLSTKLGKEVELILEGGTTEIDKGMIEKLVDPLTHLVRNSIDHGIEMKQAKMKKARLFCEPSKKVAAFKSVSLMMVPDLIVNEYSQKQLKII
jgi:two-component system chemotaxis sensor kinase CheA